jgi:hypothetical protein
MDSFSHRSGEIHVNLRSRALSAALGSVPLAGRWYELIAETTIVARWWPKKSDKPLHGVSRVD